MENAKITLYQFFTLQLLFGIGTAMMFTLGGEAKQASWLAILLGMALGVVLYLIYYDLYRKYSNLPLTAYSQRIFGRPIGQFISISYMSFFLYGASRNVRDGIELVSLSYGETPKLVLGIMLVAVVLYAIFNGIEVISRVGEMYIFLFFFITILAIIGLFSSGVVKGENLLPVLEPGWKTILKTTMQQTWMWPFGEMVCFTMILPYLNHPKQGLKVGLLGVILTGLFLAMVHSLEVAVLGVEQADRSVFPFMEMSQKINVGDVIQRLDAFVMVTIIVNVFFKITIYIYVAVVAAANVFPVSKNKLFIPMGIVVLMISIFFTESMVGHWVQGSFVLKNVYPFFGAFIPLTLWIGAILRKKIFKRSHRF
ncbi:GerAB/ArcD/ProY family transporter [Ammoniphilus sp. 3BR4]